MTKWQLIDYLVDTYEMDYDELKDYSKDELDELFIELEDRSDFGELDEDAGNEDHCF